MVVFLAVLLIFSSKTSKFRHSVTKSVSFWGLPSPRLPGPLLSHILNTPLVVADGNVSCLLLLLVKDVI